MHCYVVKWIFTGVLILFVLWLSIPSSNAKGEEGCKMWTNTVLTIGWPELKTSTTILLKFLHTLISKFAALEIESCDLFVADSLHMT